MGQGKQLRTPPRKGVNIFPLLSIQKISGERETTYTADSISDLALSLLAISSAGCSGDHFVPAVYERCRHPSK